MALTVSLFGTNREIPEAREQPWGSEMTKVIQDLMLSVNSLLNLVSSNYILKLDFSTLAALAASATITSVRTLHRVVSTGGAVILDATTAIADPTGANGQLLVLVGTSNTNTVQVNTGANTDFKGGNVVLAEGDSIILWFDNVRSLWIELARS